MTAASVAFIGGRILTMDPTADAPDAVVVTGDRIAAVGDRAMLACHPHAQIVDLAGRTLLPGFIDAHNHLSLAALHPRWADLAHARDVTALQSALRTHARDEPDTAWVRGHGWELNGPLPLTRHDLDALELDRPVLVAHFSFHMGVVSSLGLEQLGITRTTPDPPGGTIERDGVGFATGMLRERAWSRAHAASLAAPADPDRWDDLIVDRMRTLLAHGVTAVHDAACPPAGEAAYRRLRDAGRMELSVLTMPHPAEVFTGPEDTRLDGPPTGEGDEWLRVGPVKLFADGGSHPHIDAHVDGHRIAEGHAFPHLVGDARRASDRSFDIATHAMATPACDARSTPTGRCGAADPTTTVSCASSTPPWPDPPRSGRWTTSASSRWCNRGSSTRSAGASVICGSTTPLGCRSPTWPTPASPWQRPRTTRSGPASPLTTSRLATGAGAPRDLPAGSHQPLPLPDWLRAWTVGAAVAGGQHHERGTITPGKRADLVALDGDPADPRTRVAQTWVAGRRRFDRDEPDVTARMGRARN